MTLYVTVSRGIDSEGARPILATSDQRVIEAVLTTLANLDEDSGSAPMSGQRSVSHAHRRQIEDARIVEVTRNSED